MTKYKTKLFFLSFASLVTFGKIIFYNLTYIFCFEILALNKQFQFDFNPLKICWQPGFCQVEAHVKKKELFQINKKV